ncbi:MAG TPA: YgiT-type zinc finger domain-containing protein [Gammaproteobacteria bacterium]|nr:YgiT-type zinc finger protein [Candidatus Parabeggiatoa sp.]HAI69191.1 YgiT-type zinc finger domain-containing protein [Gammaproteobacteria bacterium]
MFYCHVCGSKEAKEESIQELFHIEGKPVLVENIPALICSRCGEATLSRETTEQIRQMVQGEAKPVKSISMDVFDFLTSPRSQLVPT